MKKTTGIIIVLLAALAIGVGVATSNHGKIGSSNHKVQIVVGENFWGSLASQLGGNRAQVTSIVSDPNADPHEYESSATTARRFAAADYVVINGAGYDGWADKLLSADSNGNRKVLKVANLLGKKEGDNPHFWYNPAYVNEVVVQMDNDLIKIDPSGKSYYQQQLVKLQSALAIYQGRINDIKQKYGGTKAAATEDIFAYLSDAAGLDLISPPAFTQAVAEGNDPPAASVVTFQQQLNSGQVKVLVYNTQTVTPLTDSIKKLAHDNHIPVVGISETVQPPNAKFQDWMNGELVALENTLQSATPAQ